MIDDRLADGMLEVRSGSSDGVRVSAEVAFTAIRWAYSRGYQDSLVATMEERAREGWVAAERANRALAASRGRRK